MSPEKPRPHVYIGLMSGTSLDGIDATVVDFSDDSPRLLSCLTQPMDRGLKQRILALCSPGHNEIDAMGELDRELGLCYAQTVNELLQQAQLKPEDIRAIGCHGQTVRHRPDAQSPFTLQLGDPSTLALESGITTVAHFRQADMAAGGQGAPLVPAFHQAAFQHPDHERVILNIGGIANITILPAKPGGTVTGFDTGPGNLLLNAWIDRNQRLAFDEKGCWGKSGLIRQDLLDDLLSDPYFATPPPKSTGREYFNLDWLKRHLDRFPHLAAEDVQASLTELTAQSIASAIKQQATQVRELLVCGGGVHNDHLMERLRQQLPGISVCSTEKYAIDPDMVEATAFAWLAKQCLDGQPANLPSVTGARRKVILGGIYPSVPV